MVNIDSHNNLRFKAIKKLKDKKYRMIENRLLVEGPVVLSEIIKFNYIEELIIEDEKKKELQKKFPNLLTNTQNIISLSKDLFKKLQDTEQSQGIIGVVKNPVKNINFNRLQGRYLYTDGIQDPGNMGGLIRSCEAFSFDGILLGPHCVDVTNPKVIRSSMASIFRLNVYSIEDFLLEELIKNGQFLIVLDLDGKMTFENIKDINDLILVVGNEAKGPRDTIKNLAKEIITIPLSKNVNSLNANVAASIAMYELRGGSLR